MHIKSFLAIIFGVALLSSMSAQDTILMLSGHKRVVIVKKVGLSTVEYVRFDNPSGALYEVEKSEIYQIKYQNGITDELNPQGTGQALCQSKGQFLDERDNTLYRFVVIGSQTWMAENVKCSDVGGFNISGDCAECCMYFNYENALKACPPGWHLPTDKEWIALEVYLGMDPADAESIGWRGTGYGQAPALMKNGPTGFNVSLCGYIFYDPQSQVNDIISTAGVKEDAYYWTSTEKKPGKAYYRQFGGRRSICRDNFPEDYMLPVRCLKD